MYSRIRKTFNICDEIFVNTNIEMHTTKSHVRVWCIPSTIVDIFEANI